MNAKVCCGPPANNKGKIKTVSATPDPPITTFPKLRLTSAEIWATLCTEALPRVFAIGGRFTHYELGRSIAVIADRK